MTKRPKMDRRDWQALGILIAACCVIAWMTGCSGSLIHIGDQAIHAELKPNNQIGTSRSNQAGDESEVWPETTGGGSIGTDAIEAVVPVLP